MEAKVAAVIAVIISAGIFYGVFALASWLSGLPILPLMITVIGVKLAFDLIGVGLKSLARGQSK